MDEEKKKTTRRTTKKTTEAEPVKEKKTTTAKKATTKKTTTKKETTTKKAETKKTTTKAATKKTTAKAASEPKKKSTAKKTEKTEPKKTTTRKTKAEKEKEEQLKQLEKTMIFDGSQSRNLEEVVNKLEEDNVVLENKVVKRSAFNKNMIILLTCAIVIVIVGVLIYTIDFFGEKSTVQEGSGFNANNYTHVEVDEEGAGSGNVEVNDEPTTMHAIEYNNLETITVDEFEAKLVNGERMLVLISSETCYYCVVSESTLDEVLREKGKMMYRLSITSMTDEETERLRSYYPFTVAPTILAIEDGQVVSEVEGTQSKNDFGTWVDNNTQK